MRTTLSSISTFILGALLFGFAGIIFAWTGPTQDAPGGNVNAPINSGTIDQIKDSGLSVNSLAVFGNTILSGSSRYLNFGTTAGSSGYGIRNNGGTIEYKNSGGSWAGIGSGGGGGGSLEDLSITTHSVSWGSYGEKITNIGDGVLGNVFVQCSISKVQLSSKDSLCEVYRDFNYPNNGDWVIRVKNPTPNSGMTNCGAICLNRPE